jgi:hypothetical protein
VKRQSRGRETEIEVDFDGKKYQTTYSVSGDVVTVEHPHYGIEATQIGGSNKTSIVRILFLEMLQKAKTKGLI